jgi:hypothetical protein
MATAAADLIVGFVFGVVDVLGRDLGFVEGFWIVVLGLCREICLCLWFGDWILA